MFGHGKFKLQVFRPGFPTFNPASVVLTKYWQLRTFFNWKENKNKRRVVLFIFHRITLLESIN